MGQGISDAFRPDVRGDETSYRGRLCFADQDAVATEKDQILTVTLLNRSFGKKKKFILPGYAETYAVAHTVPGADQVLPYSDFETTQTELVKAGENLEVVLPEHSVMLIQMKKE